jgi:hypothetical protein
LSAIERDAVGRAVSEAALYGVSEAEIREVLLKELEGASTVETGASRAVARLNARAETANTRQRLVSRTALLAFVLADAALDYQLSDKDLVERVRSGKLADLSVRGGAALLAIEVERRMSQQLLRGADETAAGKVARDVGGRVFRVRVVGLGIATVIFVAGEGLIAALHGESTEEVAGRVGEAVLVMAIAEGSVIAAELIFAGEIGAFGGPVGIAISLAATSIYEGAKYAWNASKEHDADIRVYLARCDALRENIRKWSQKTQETVGMPEK